MWHGRIGRLACEMALHLEDKIDRYEDGSSNILPAENIDPTPFYSFRLECPAKQQRNGKRKWTHHRRTRFLSPVRRLSTMAKIPRDCKLALSVVESSLTTCDSWTTGSQKLTDRASILSITGYPM